MTMSQPAVSVVVPAFNMGGKRAKYFRAALESIAAQTHSDFEVILVNDGSRDDTLEIAREYLSDNRFHVFSLEQNQGLVRALRHGISHARGRFIARMDADDLMTPQRLVDQEAYMKSRPYLQICGTQFTVIDNSGTQIKKIRRPESYLEIREFISVSGSPFAHPSVMFRAETPDLVGHYSTDPRFRFADDFEYWTRILNLSRGENLGYGHLFYRDHVDPNRIGSGSYGAQMAAAETIMVMARPWFRLEYFPDWMMRRLGREAETDAAKAELELAPAPWLRLAEWCSGATFFVDHGYGSVLFTGLGSVTERRVVESRPLVKELLEERHRLEKSVFKNPAELKFMASESDAIEGVRTVCFGGVVSATAIEKWLARAPQATLVARVLVDQLEEVRSSAAVLRYEALRTRPEALVKLRVR